MEKLLDRKSLLTRRNLQIKKVELGEGEFVYVREMTGRDREFFDKSIVREGKDEKGKTTGETEMVLDDFRAKLAVNTLCDEKGELLLQPEDYIELSKNMSARRLMKIADAASKLNKISDTEKEEILKNSDGGQAANSNSDSVEN